MSQPIIALTFDDGPNTVITPQVLDILEENGAVGTFFLIAQNITPASAEMVRRAVAMGCDIENHSVTHGFMNQMYARFVANGIPVIIGEFGSVNKNNLQDRVNFTAYYVAAARQHNMPCLIWDNAAFRNSDELFGLMDRRRCTWTFPEIIDAMIRYGRY